MKLTEKSGSHSIVSGKENKVNQKKSSTVSTECTDSRRGRTLFFGNVPCEFSKKRFLKLVKRYGEVERMWIRGIKPQSANIPKKIALVKHLLAEDHPPLLVYVLFKTAPDAEHALQLNGEMFEDHRLRVTLSENKEYDRSKGVFVGNLPLAVQEDQIHGMFNKCGDIVGVRIIRDKITGKGKGFGYVNFQSSDAVELALKLNGETLNNRDIRVQRLQSVKKIKKQNKKIKRVNSYVSRKSKQSCKKKKNITKTELKKKMMAKLLSQGSSHCRKSG